MALASAHPQANIRTLQRVYAIMTSFSIGRVGESRAKAAEPRSHDRRIVRLPSYPYRVYRFARRGDSTALAEYGSGNFGKLAICRWGGTLGSLWNFASYRRGWRRDQPVIITMDCEILSRRSSELLAFWRDSWIA